MSAVDFDVLKLIPKMLEEMQDLKKEVTELKQHIKPEYDLTKRAGVMAYLKVSNNTITRYISEGTFKEGYHYHRELKNNASKIIFVSGAIKEFKKEKTK
ncbi:hypothetical protein QUR76_06720 [Arcobacter cryaerophilus gv. pseudocryaerophilus]|uniref:Uncharacterized protein n=3 Tax=unclassified Arcobacter TaxID=2593671 RepID=A0AA96DGW8_9BACT|nr:hypothetical protein RMQ65_01375 [Arcobacter sp. AZ-2023]WPD04818.1 hypothetical protein QUR76_06720 [Arcobacter sp. DSM 115956]WPD06913.1 hypothetical protein QUR78_06720 [Arcobacter sp. DSM 115955]WNL31178.1 hypothetical protein RMQ67_06720 [Arcobacter sp. AZ-2023]WNP37328.1 hypothetical protein RJG58_06720 [Arcobacter sp. AZ-2023]